MNKIIFYWNVARNSFWFLPILFVFGAILLAFSFVSVDRILNVTGTYYDIIRIENFNAARSLLSAIASAMISVAGTVFSVTLVVLTLASSQFGSQLIKNFIGVRINQIVLGSYISTFLYCLIIVLFINEDSTNPFIPSISIYAAILAALLNIILLIFFIHNVASEIQVNKVINNIYSATLIDIERIYPKGLGEEPKQEIPKAEIQQKIESCVNSAKLVSNTSGYLQYVDYDSIIKKLIESDAILMLEIRPGDFILEQMEVGCVYFLGDEARLDEESIFSDIIIGSSRTSQQDIEFSINQIVQVAAKALSPGVNDPYTAITCIDNLSGILTRLMQIEIPSEQRLDEEGQLRIIAENFDFEGIVRNGFDQIRQYSENNISVNIRLAESLKKLHKIARNDTQKRSINYQASLLREMGQRSIKEKGDLDDLLRRLDWL